MNSRQDELCPLYLQTLGIPPVEQRGSSSIEGTEVIRSQLATLFSKYNIKSIFDAGATDAAWQVATIAKQIKYFAGEICQKTVNYAQWRYPELDIRQHDIVHDAIPDADLLFVRDVTIHLNNEQKKSFIQRWLSSKVPYLLISHNVLCTQNKDFVLTSTIQFADVNWCISPWHWPDPLENIWENNPNGRSMSLWHQSQIKERIQ